MKGETGQAMQEAKKKKHLSTLSSSSDVPGIEANPANTNTFMGVPLEQLRRGRQADVEGDIKEFVVARKSSFFHKAPSKEALLSWSKVRTFPSQTSRILTRILGRIKISLDRPEEALSQGCSGLFP